MHGNMFSSTLTVLCFVAVAMGDFEAHIRENGKDIKEQCIKDTSVNHDLIDKVNEGSFTDDRNLKCYMKCLFEMFGVKFNDDGSVNTDSLKAVIPEEHHDTYVDLVMKCAHIKDTDLCDSSYLTHVCYHTNSPDLHFLL